MSSWREICAEYDRAAADLQRAQHELAVLNRYAVELDWPQRLLSTGIRQSLEDLLKAHRDLTAHIDADLR